MGVMRRGGRLALFLAAAMMAASVFTAAPAPAKAQEGLTLEWFGWSHFRFTSPTGKIIHTNPFINGNPDAAISLDDITRAELVLAADAHGDEVGQTVPIAQKTGAMVLAAGGGLNGWLMEQGVPQAQIASRVAGPGSFYKLGDITVIVMNSLHSSEIGQPSAANPYGGLAGGFMIKFENGYTIYFSGSSAATSDMALWAEMYKPDLMIFHMAGNHDAMDVAMTLKLMTTNNPNLKMAMPHHHRVQIPAGQTTIADVQAAMAQLGVSVPITDQVRSQVYPLAK
jgi:L-ascorbate metabolism protein UlaG (beta-lactamase superfamily)